jgi:ADP-dependent phosphofructokinase/glucokinase
MKKTARQTITAKINELEARIATLDKAHAKLAYAILDGFCLYLPDADDEPTARALRKANEVVKSIKDDEDAGRHIEHTKRDLIRKGVRQCWNDYNDIY